MFLKSAKCPQCRYSLPLCSAFYKISLPPRQINCPGCKKAIATSFEFRMNWTSNLIFRICVLGFFVYILFGMLGRGVPLLGALAAAGFLGLCAGAVTALIAGFVLAPVLQVVFDTGHAAKRVAESTKGGKEASDEEARLAEYLQSSSDNGGRSQHPGSQQ